MSASRSCDECWLLDTKEWPSRTVQRGIRDVDYVGKARFRYHLHVAKT